MGHYWSEMQGDSVEPPRHPKPLDSMGFVQHYTREFDHQANDFWVHKPCLQVFYIRDGRYEDKIPDAIYHHANHCPMKESN